MTHCPRCKGEMPEGQCVPCCKMIGERVAERLAKVPGVVKLPTPHLQMYLMRDFLSGEECGRLVAAIDEGRQPSGILTDKPDPTFRTSDSCNLDRNDAFVKHVEGKITAVLGIQEALGETIQGQRYAPGQYFKPHNDYFHMNQPYWQVERKQGGQRTWTAMISLNEPEEGGGTFFPTAGIRVKPRIGNLIIWNNLGLDGRPNVATLHEGEPVIAGTKYIITKWYRERRWGIVAPVAPSRPGVRAGARSAH